MSRIIINYDDNIPTKNALNYVEVVVQQGRMSGLHKESYYYCSKFTDETMVFANVTQSGTDVFNIRSRKNEIN